MEVLWTNFKTAENVCVLQKSVFLFSNTYRIIFLPADAAGGEIVYIADAELDHGDGVRCTAAHESIPIFAFAEMSSNPRLLVKSYPSFGAVTFLQSSEAPSYLSMCFSNTDYLIALTGIDTFSLEMWNWRQSQLLGVQKTGVLSVEQSISCMSLNQLTLVQYAKQLKELRVWNLNFCIDSVKVVEVDLSHCGEKSFSVEGYTVFNDDCVIFYDSEGNISITSISRRSSHLIVDKIGNVRTVCPFEKGFLCSTDEELIYFHQKESEELSFERFKSIQLNDSIVKLVELDGNTSFGFSDSGKWNRISMGQSLEISAVMSLNFNYKYRAVYKDEIFLVTDNNRIEIWDIERKLLKTVFTECSTKEITCMTINSSNLLLGTSDSRILIYHHFKLEIHLLQELFLSEDSITSIKYTDNFIVSVDDKGAYFIIDRHSFDVLNYISYSGIALELLLIEKDCENLQLYFFEKSQKNKFSSIKLEFYQFNSVSNLTKKLNVDLPFPIASVAHVGKGTKFVVNQFLTRELQIISIEINSAFETIQIEEIKRLNLESKFKYIQLKSIGEFFLAYGFDGDLTLLDEDGEVLQRITISHRLNGEIKDVIFEPNSCILATDADSNTFCIKTGLSRHEDQKSHSNLPPQIPQINSIHHPTVSWLQSHEHKNLQSEMQDNKQICQEISEEMQVLRKEINLLLNQNETKPEDEKLPIQQFNLNGTQCELLNKEAVDMDTKKDMLKVIDRENSIRKWLMDNCWKVMAVKSTLINGIFWGTCVENFTLLHEDPEMNLNLQESIKRFHIEQLTNSDVFLPFAPIDTNHLEKILSQEPECCKADDIKPVSNRRPEISGTTTIQFITPAFDRYSQMEVVTYQQCHMEEIFGHFDMLALKSFFNNKFSDIQQLKAIQMNAIKEKNERLRVIHSELNELARLTNSRIMYKGAILDPKFTLEETPQQIITVLESEMSCKPFQAATVRTQQSDEETEEEVVQELFNSAFREKCLQTMMDGVLEIRWEDEIKKTPAVPVALQARKDLRDYDEHDMRAVKEYEDKLNFLGEERERYKGMLLAERGLLLKEVDDTIRSFNYKLAKLINLKINVEMAVNQESFKLLRNRHFNRMRIDFAAAENEIKSQVQGIKKEIGHLTNFIHEFEKKIQEYKMLCETSETKDRQMDKQFKNNFAEVSSHAIVDQAYKFFKRRSRWTPKPWATAAILNDIARRIISRNVDPSGPPLHQDCFDFLNIIEQHDQITNCPNIIDERLWDILCRMRRAKIESEFKVRGIAAALSEAEQAFQALSKEIGHKKWALVALDKKIAEVKEKRQVNMINRTVQLVVKRGAIEVDLAGKLNDFDDTLLIAKSEVDEVNKLIRRAGLKKLAAMNNAAIFRRKVLHKEWEHQVLKMKIRDMRSFVICVESCKITKDVQRWLMKKQKGRTEDVSQLALNKEIDSLIGGFEREFEQVDTELKTLCRKIQIQRLKNRKLDVEIESLNLDVGEQQKLHDTELEETIVTDQNFRLSAIAERTRLMRRIQKQHSQIVELTSLLELQRLRTYPTLNEYR